MCLIAVVACACFVVIFQYAFGCLAFGIKWPEHFYDSPTTMALALSVFAACDLYPLECFAGSLRRGGIVAKVSDCIMGIYIIHPFLWEFVKHFYGFDNPALNFAVVVFVGTSAFAVTCFLKRLPCANCLVKL